jgi:hypothetical protein
MTAFKLPWAKAINNLHDTIVFIKKYDIYGEFHEECVDGIAGVYQQGFVFAKAGPVQEANRTAPEITGYLGLAGNDFASSLMDHTARC